MLQLQIALHNLHLGATVLDIHLGRHTEPNNVFDERAGMYYVGLRRRVLVQ